jgi:ABC-2 type transport system permease protein
MAPSPPPPPPPPPRPTPTPASAPPPAPGRGPGPGPGRAARTGRGWALRPLYGLLLRSQLNRARLLGLLAVGAIGVVVGLAVGAADVWNPVRAATRFIDVFGLSLLVPVATLVFASATLGEPNEDGTLVYLWLRPVARGQIVLAAALASFTVTWPLVVGPLVLAALATGSGGGLIAATVASATAGMIAYTGLFVALGLRVKRALVWGLLAIFIWEGFVATGNPSAARFSIRSYTRSILADGAGVQLDLADFNLVLSWAVPLATAAVALGYATWRLRRQDVA